MERQYKLDWKKLLWDKGAFALLGAAAIFLVNGCLETRRQNETRELEQYKLDEARQRFFLEKRLEATLNLSSAMSKITSVYFANAGKTPVPVVAEDDYKAALNDAREVINRYQLLFDVSFRQDVDRYFEVHRSLSKINSDRWGDYQGPRI